MKNRSILFAAAAVLLSTLTVSAAPLLVDKGSFSLTYPDGWAVSPFIPANDSTAIVMNTDNNAMSWAIGNNQTGGLTAEQYISVMTQAQTLQMQRTDSSVKTLGGKVFHTSGWKDTSADGEGSRLRIYAYSQGNSVFISWLIYESPAGDAAVAQQEAALATLTLKGVSIRPVFWSRKTDVARTRLDILGRTWSPSMGRTPHTAYFLKR